MSGVTQIGGLTLAQTREDVSDLLAALLVKDPFLGLIRVGASAVGDGERKFSWPELLLSQTTGTLTANYTAGGLSFTVSNSAIFRVNDIIHILNHVDSNNMEVKYRVTAIPNGTTLTVVLVNGIDTSHTTAQGAVIYRHGTVEDNSTATASDGATESTLVSNYLHLFRDGYKIGRKEQELALANGIMGMENAIDRARLEAALRVRFQIYNGTWQGVGAGETTSRGATMSGIEKFVNTSSPSNRVDAGGNALTADDINDAIEQLYGLGLARGTRLTLVVSPKNARSISALKTTTQIYYPDPNAAGNVGQNVQTFISDLPGFDSVSILVDNNRPDYNAYLLDTSSMEFVPKGAGAGAMAESMGPVAAPFAWEEDITGVGQYGITRAMYAELSLRVFNATQRNGVIYNIVP